MRVTKTNFKLRQRLLREDNFHKRNLYMGLCAVGCGLLCEVLVYLSSFHKEVNRKKSQMHIIVVLIIAQPFPS